MIEDYLWERLVAELLDPDRVRAHLADARARRLEFHQRYQDRATATEASLAKEQKRLERIIHRINSFDPDVLTDEDREELAAQERDRDETKKTLAALRRKLDDLRAEVDAAPVGLSEAGLEEITRFIAELQVGASVVTPAERRQILDLLHIRGQAWPGDEIAVGRKPVRTVNVEWRGELLVHSDPRFHKRGKSQRGIARELGRSRVTVARVLTEPVDCPPPRRARAKLTDPYRDQIARWLQAGLTAVRMFELAREDAVQPYRGQLSVFRAAVRGVAAVGAGTQFPLPDCSTHSHIACFAISTTMRTLCNRAFTRHG